MNVHEAKAQLSRLLDRVSRGEEIVIAKAGRPVACLVAATSQPEWRVLGSARGELVVGPEFDEPLPEEVLEDFEW